MDISVKATPGSNAERLRRPDAARVSPLRVDLLYPTLPPAPDAIGDYTTYLADALAREVQVKIWSASPEAAVGAGILHQAAFTLDTPTGVRRLAAAIRQDPPDWLVVQYNPFSYGRRGFSPLLPHALRQVRREVPGLQLAVMMHEPFVPITSWRNALMTTYQRLQLRGVGRAADVVFCSIEAWARRFQPWFPGKPVLHLPVGSNLPYLGASRAEARRRLGLNDDTPVVGLFGCARPARLLDLVAQTVDHLRRERLPVVVLYIGAHGAEVRQAMGGAPVLDAGRLPGDDVSRAFAAMDVYLAPFPDGASTRRSSFMAGLQHGVATVGTDGSLTDTMLRQAHGDAFLLAPVDQPALFEAHVRTLLTDPRQAHRLGASARAFYTAHFEWEEIARQTLDHLHLETRERS